MIKHTHYLLQRCALTKMLAQKKGNKTQNEMYSTFRSAIYHTQLSISPAAMKLRKIFLIRKGTLDRNTVHIVGILLQQFHIQKYNFNCQGNK